MGRKQWVVSEFTLKDIQYPDELHHPYAMLRAWDRHLLSVGLLPISTSDSSKVGPILVNPDGTGEHYEYRFDSRGSLALVTVFAPLQQADMQKATCSA